jgi:uncharacterized protein YPO0396
MTEQEQEELNARVEAITTSLHTMPFQVKKIIDTSVFSLAEQNTTLKASVAADIRELTYRVDALQQAITATNHEVKRYFDKEKYAITKGIVTQIIKEEKLHG